MFESALLPGGSKTIQLFETGRRTGVRAACNDVGHCKRDCSSIGGGKRDVCFFGLWFGPGGRSAALLERCSRRAFKIVVVVVVDRTPYARGIRNAVRTRVQTVVVMFLDFTAHIHVYIYINIYIYVYRRLSVGIIPRAYLRNAASRVIWRATTEADEYCTWVKSRAAIRSAANDGGHGPGVYQKR